MTANANNYNNEPSFYASNGVPSAASGSPLTPDILPLFDSSAVSAPDVTGNGSSISFLTTAAYLAQFPRLAAKGTVTLTGTVTTGDTAYINIINGLLPGGFVQVSTLALAGDTLVTIAQRLVVAINSNATLKTYGVYATEALVGGNQVISLNWPGPCGNFATLAGWSFSSLETLTLTGSETDGDVLTTTLTAAGGFGANTAAITVGGTVTTGDVSSIKLENPVLSGGSTTVSYTSAGGNTTSSIATGLAAAIAANATLVAALGLTVVAQGPVVYLTWSALVGQVTFDYATSRLVTETVTLLANGGAQPSALAPTAPQTETITIGGTVTTGDLVKLNLYAANFSPVHSVSYVTQGGDTTATIAAALTAAINADALLIGYQVTAVVLGSVITVTWLPLKSGLIVFGSSVTAVPTEQLSTTLNPTAVALVVTTAGSESETTIATAMKNLINANVILTAAGVIATSSSAIVSIFSNGNLGLTYGFTNSGTTEIGTFANSTPNTITIAGSATAGDTDYASFTTVAMGTVQVSSPVTAAESVTNQAVGLAAAINANRTLSVNGITATSSLGVVTVAVAPLFQVPTILAWADYSASDEVLLTMTGTMTTGDVVNVNFTNASLPGGYHNVQYAVVGGDTTLTLLATHIKQAINLDATCIAAGISATSAIGVVSILSAITIGSLTVAASVNGIETVTISGATPTSGEIPVLTITDANLPGGVLAVPYTLVGGDTTNTLIATHLTTALTTGAIGTALAAVGITATSLGAVVSLVSTSTKPTTYSRTNSANTTYTLLATQTEVATVTGGATETLTVAQTGFGTETLTQVQPVGGSGPIIPLQTWVYSPASYIPGDGLGSSVKLAAGKPAQLDYQSLHNLIQDGAPIM